MTTTAQDVTRPDGSTPGGTGDPYTATLAELAVKAVTLYSSLHGALACADHQRWAILSDLHHQVRAMAAVLNETLGILGRPPPHVPGCNRGTAGPHRQPR